MSKATPEVYRKAAKWMDDIKKDNKYYGVGTVNNMVHFPNGKKIEEPFEDRAFSYEFIENEIYAYGLLDGYNGIWAVDLVDQCILTNMYFDHLSTLKKKSDEEIYAILKGEFNSAEQTLQENLNELLMKRASYSILGADLRRGSVEYFQNKEDIKAVDSQLKSGVFALVTLIIDKRLFITNLGTNHCFVCLSDKNKCEKQVMSCCAEHKLSNIEEMRRLIKLGANIAVDDTESSPIKYTRCLGDFTLKLYYNESPHFNECTGPPLSAVPDHPSRSLVIDDSYLFMVIYPDGLAKAIESTDLKFENVDAEIAKMLIAKIISEQTLNSAAQSVLDEIKRAYDDKFVSEYSEREDLTLIVRIFEPLASLKARLIEIENISNQASYQTLNDEQVQFIETTDHDLINSNESINSTLYNSNLNSTNISSDQSLRSSHSYVKSIQSKEKFIDENGKVIPYVNFDQLHSLLADEENKQIFDDLSAQLRELESNEETNDKELDNIRI